MEPRSPSNDSGTTAGASGNTGACWKCGAAVPGLPGCAACGALQDVPAGVTHFEVLGIPERLQLDDDVLRGRLYDLSKQTHPDRFAGHEGREPSFALRWTTAINRAYQTLRDQVKRSRYVLERHGKEDAKPLLPLDLAETYFDIQESGAEQLAGFRGQLERMLADAEAEWNEIAKDHERGVPKALDRLAAHLTRRKYLSSMLADIDHRMTSQKQGVRDGDYHRSGQT